MTIHHASMSYTALMETGEQVQGQSLDPPTVARRSLVRSKEQGKGCRERGATQRVSGARSEAKGVGSATATDAFARFASRASDCSTAAMTAKLTLSPKRRAESPSPEPGPAEVSTC